MQSGMRESKSFRALAMYYKDTINYLENSKIEFEDNVLELLPMS